MRKVKYGEIGCSYSTHGKLPLVLIQSQADEEQVRVALTVDQAEKLISSIRRSIYKSRKNI
tara:strand:- start:1557 stop:1739 length:183 start_codon:yes stop_codon:yes gene_type:complete